MRLAWTAVVVLLLARVAIAAPSLSTDTSPWSVGVSEEKMAAANVLLSEGNTLFLETHYTAALAKFRAAVDVWDHPAIRFNIVRCLIELDRPIEAQDNLELALRFGSAPLEDVVYREALSYKKLLAKQVGQIAIACEQRGVAVSVDGNAVGTCPLQLTQRVLAGRHQVLGTGDGLVPRVTDLVVVGGDSARADVRLESPASGPSGRTVGKAALYSGGGLVLVSSAIALYAWHHYHAQFPSHCSDAPLGGAPLCDEQGASELDSARVYGDVATVAGGIGIAAVIAGTVVLFRSRADRPHAAVTPSATGVGLTLEGRF
ncbi:MAG TPA: hypothetical protein VGM90_28670 [Kofleriaceae bacterium]|jgi:hypothetical protein